MKRQILISSFLVLFMMVATSVSMADTYEEYQVKNGNTTETIRFWNSGTTMKESTNQLHGLMDNMSQNMSKYEQERNAAVRQAKSKSREQLYAEGYSDKEIKMLEDATKMLENINYGQVAKNLKNVNWEEFEEAAEDLDQRYNEIHNYARQNGTLVRYESY